MKHLWPWLWLAQACAPMAAPQRDATPARGPRLVLEPALGGGWRSPSTASIADLAWADVNGDGALDLGLGSGPSPFIGTTPEATAAYTVLTRVDGNLVPTFVTAANHVVLSSAWADIDGDGDPDLMIGTSNGLIRAQNEDGVLTEEPRQTDSLRTTSLRWADVDADGDPDLAQGGKNGLVLWRNDGAGGLDREVLADQLGVFDLAWVDRDGDGLPELSVATYEGLWILDNPEGSLTIPASPALLAGTPVHRVAWADWVGDGRLHPALATEHEVRAFASSGDGFQERLIRERVDAVPYTLAFADFDVDGYLDLAIGWDSGAVEVRRGYEAFTGRVLELAWDDGDGLDPVLALAPGDWDGDGDPDLAVGRGNQFTGATSTKDLRTTGVYESLEGSDGTAPLDVTLGYARAWATADWDGDGDWDVASEYTVDEGTLPRSAVALAINDPAGWTTQPAFAFPPPTDDDSLGGITIWNLQFADVDVDGDLDVGLATSIGVVLLENRAGQLITAWNEPYRPFAFGVAFADFDDDGDLDLASGGVGVRLYVNDAGTFRLRTEVPARDAFSLAWAHLDRAGPWRLAFTDLDLKLRVLEPGAAPDDPWVERPLIDPPDGICTLVAADVDNDGDDELFLSRYLGTSDEIVDVQGVRVETIWEADRSSGSDAAIGRVEATDLDNDGFIDFSTPTAEYQHRGDTWVPWRTYACCSLVVDVAGDGFPDLLASTGSGWGWKPNVRGGDDSLPFNPPRLKLAWANAPLAGANATGAPARLEDGPLEIVLTATDAESDPITGVRFEFRDWRGGWRPATVDGLSGELATSPEGVAHRGTWRWVDDGADGERVVLRALLERPSGLGGEIRGGRVAASSTDARLRLDSDGDGRRESADLCPFDKTNDSLVPGTCDSDTLAEGWWCAAGGAPPGGLAAGLVALLAAGARRRSRGPAAR